MAYIPKRLIHQTSFVAKGRHKNNDKTNDNDQTIRTLLNNFHENVFRKQMKGQNLKTVIESQRDDILSYSRVGEIVTPRMNVFS